MSNYTITTDFGAKDSLPSSNSAKVVRGSEFTTEFTNIQTAIATKADTAGDTFTGVVNFSADVAVNTNTLFVDVSEAKVGIGNTSPAEKLDVSSAGTTRIQVKNTNLTSSGLYIAEDATGAQINELGAYPIRFNTSGTERMRIDSSGKVGIGTTSPSTTLDVHSSTNGHGLYIAQDNAGVGYHTRLTFQGSNGSGGYNTIAGLKAYQEANGTNGYLRFDTNGDNERMRIDASGHLLVGTTEADVGYTDSGAGFSAHPDGYVQAARSSTSALSVLYLNKLDNDGSILEFSKDGTAVGSIGTVSGDIRIGGSDDNHAGIRFAASTKSVIPVKNTDGDLSDNTTDLGASNSRFKDLYLSGAGYIPDVRSTSNQYITHNDGNFLAIRNSSGAERMRIDSSGNVLVGKTSYGVQTQGFGAYASGAIEANGGNAPAAYFNRTTGDGELLNFRKDNTTVGSIGTSGSRPYFSNNVNDGIKIADDYVAPCNQTGADKDASLDLGSSSVRFKDLYLSGGVHLGGTATANKLDDYEEGTWTPVIYGSTGGTGSGTIVNAKYTKVGGLVQVMCYINSYDVTGLSGAVRLSGLPFNSNGYHISVIGYCNMFSTDEASVSVSGYTESGSDKIYLTKGSSTTLIPASEATNSSSQLMLNFTYATTS